MIKRLFNSRVYMMIGITILMISVIAAGTYAWFTWSSKENTNLNLKIGEIAKVTFKTGDEINVTDLAPVYNYFDGAKTEFSIENKVKDDTAVEYVISVNVTSISPELKDKNFKFALVRGNGEKLPEPSSSDNVTYGDFKNATDNNISVGTGELSKGVTKFAFYVYIDGNEENNINMKDKSFQGKLIVTAREKNTGAGA